MMKVNIERRSIDVPAACLAPGTFFTYPDCPLVSWGYSVEDGEGYISLVGKGW